MKKSDINIIIVPSVVFIISSFLYEFVYDDSYDAFASNICSLQFSDFSLMDQHYLGVIGFRDVYKILQNVNSEIIVFANMFILSNFLSLCYTLYVVEKLFYVNKNLKVLVFLFISIIFIENIISITHTRFATIFCGVSLCYMLFNKEISKKQAIIHSLIFLAGFLHRPESGMGMILIVGVGYLIKEMNPKKAMSYLAFPVFLSVLFFSSLQIHKQFTNRFEIKIEPDIEYALSTGRVIPISEMKNTRDSLRYEMATAGMFIDTSFVNVDFLRSIASNQFKIDFAKIEKSILNVLNLYKYYLIFITITLLIFFFLILTQNYFSLIKALVFSFFLFFLLIYLDYNVRVEDRHFVPIQIVAVLILSLYAKPFFIKVKVVTTLLAMIILLITNMVTLKNALGNQIQVAKDVECLESVMEDIEKVYQDRIIVATIASFHLFDKKHTFFNRNYKQNTYIMYDISNYSILPRYQKYLSQLCDCNAERPEEFLAWATKNKVIFLWNDERCELIERYFKEVHQIRLKFAADDEPHKHIMPFCMSESVHDNYNIVRIDKFEKLQETITTKSQK